LFNRVLLAGDAEAREEHSPEVRTRGFEWWLTFRNYTHFELCFRALLDEGGSKLTLV
jgi:hypothetical protein